MSAKSAFSNSTSKSYALALYELSKESSELDKIEDGIKSLNKLIKVSSNFREAISNPTVEKEEKREIMNIISDRYSFPKTLKKFLIFVAIKNRLFFLDQIIESFLNLVSLNRGELKAKLVSSKELSADERKKIQINLSQSFKFPLNIDYRYDPDLIAGLIIQVGSIMVDTSIKSKLKKLTKSMMET